MPPGVDALFQGSAVTGLNSRTRVAFDVGRHSDFDIALAGEELFEQARSLGYRVKDGSRIGPLTERQLDELGLGLSDLADRLSQLAGRPVNFMLFDSTTSAYTRPSILIY